MSTAISATVPAASTPRTAALRPRFFGAVRGEILKVMRQRSTWVMVGLGVLFFAIALAALSTEPNVEAGLHRDPHGWLALRLNIFTTVFNAGGGIFLLILTARLIAMEYSGGTIRVLLSRGTGRLQLLFAKLLTLLAVGLTLLLVYTIAAAVYVYATVVALDGSFSRIATIPTGWHDLGLSLLTALVSIAICILVATAGAVVGRSLAFGMGVALGFFPSDNFGTVVMSLLSRLTNQGFWKEVTAYFLGPNLNIMEAKLIPGQRAAFAEPLVNVTATHMWVVIAAWAVGFLLVSIVLTARRDVLQ